MKSTQSNILFFLRERLYRNIFEITNYQFDEEGIDVTYTISWKCLDGEVKYYQGNHHRIIGRDFQLFNRLRSLDILDIE